MAWFKNKRYENDLYVIVGTPADRQRVATALEWLRSPAAEGLGEQLLQRAKRLHKSPLRIDAGGYDTFYKVNAHTIQLCIDPEADPASSSIAADLAHELVHAGDPHIRIDHQWPKKYKPTMDAMMQRAIRATAGGDVTQELVPLAKNIQDAPDYQTAHAALEIYVDRSMEIFTSVRTRIDATISHDPQYIAYITACEQPAMDAENKVYRLLGMPPRKFYWDPQKNPSEALGRMVMMELETKRFAIDYKPGGPYARDISMNEPSTNVSGIAHQGLSAPIIGKSK